MEANEAPEKLYVELCSDGVYAHVKEWENSDNIEYTRTDAFIEKAARYLNCRLYNRVEVVNFGTVLESIMSKGEFVDEFRKYMKGE